MSAPSANVDIGGIVRNAHAFNPRNWGKEVGPVQDLLDGVERLFTILEERQIDFLLVGGIALLNYVEGRNTEDIDLIIASAAIEAVPELHVQGEDDDFVKAEFEGLRVDLLLTRNKLFDRVRREHRAVLRFRERKVPCVTAEGLLILKLYALQALYRQSNFSRVNLYEGDIAALLEAARPDLDRAFAVLDKYMLATDVQAVREIVVEIQHRLARFERGLGN